MAKHKHKHGGGGHKKAHGAAHKKHGTKHAAEEPSAALKVSGGTHSTRLGR
jgi:hypothetical protein